MLKRISIVLILFTSFAAPWPVVADHEQLPHEIIEMAANRIAGKLRGHKDHLRENDDELYALIDEILLPYFDIRYAGRLVLGKHWKTATAEQRDRFIDVFYKFLLQSYADGMLKLNEDAIVVHPGEVGAEDKRAVVKTDMRMEDGAHVPVNYSLSSSKAGWRVYDVRIEGVSYIQNYRNQFNAEISALGIEAVIERLQSETREADSAADS